MRIAAVAMVHNGWPIAGLTALHLIEQGVDELIIATYDAEDSVTAGLRSLQNHGLPLVILDASGADFHTASTTSVLVQLAIGRGADWIIPWGVDEFIVPKDPESTLRTELTSWNREHPTPIPMSIDVRNFLVPRDADRFSLDVLAKTTTAVKHGLWPNTEASKLAVASGAVPFVAVDFPRRVILPADQNVWLTAGAHTAQGMSSSEHSDRIIVAHVPFPDPKCFERRAHQGRALRRRFYNESTGWQSQLTADSANGIGLSIDDWWTLNTTSPEDIEHMPEGYQRDLTLATIAQRLQCSAHFLDIAASDTNGDVVPIPHVEHVPLITAAAVMKAAILTSRAVEVIAEQHADSLQEMIAGLNGELASARAELTDARTALETAHAETEATSRTAREVEVIAEQHADSLQEMIAGLNDELTNARAELADARTGLETAHAETEATSRTAREVSVRADALTRSRSWRFTAPLRNAARLSRRHR